MKQSKELSSRRLQQLITISFSVAIIIIAGIWMVYDRMTLEKQAERMYSKQVDIIAIAITPALMFSDKKLAQTLMTQFTSNLGDISILQFLNVDGTILAGFPQKEIETDLKHLENPQSQAAFYKDHYLGVSRTVSHKGLPVGIIYIEFDLSDLIGHKDADITNILFIITGILLLSLLVLRKLQHKLTDSEIKLHQAIQQAEQANRAKSEFLSTISHELRTPIHGIIGLQKLISEGAEQLNAEQRENLKLAQQSARSLRALVNDVLDLAKIESGKMDLVKKEFDLKQCICDAIIPFRILAIKKGIVLSLHIDAAPQKILSDESRLRQILLNLIGNAVKFTQRGGVSIYVKEECGKLFFVVKDSGIGIADGDLKHIFEPFVQATSKQHAQYFGSGLGTNIAKRFVELMEGKIQVKSALGEGSSFSFHIPCYPAGLALISCEINSNTDLCKLSPIVDNSAEKEAFPLRLRVLLAEDDPIAQRIARKRLSKAGMDVDIVDNGEDALLKVQSHSYDLLLTDIRMPRLDGLELTRRIRAMEKGLHGSHLTIIGLSAHVLDEVIQDCLDAGMDHFMSKPADPEMIVSTILMSKAGQEK